MPKQRIRVLLVCDDPFTLELIRICLARKPFSLTSCASDAFPEPGLSCDLALLDLPESRPSGVALWKKLHAAMPQTPLLILHALAGPEKAHFEQKIRQERRFAPGTAKTHPFARGVNWIRPCCSAFSACHWKKAAETPVR